jgi:hypothetical protein
VTGSLRDRARSRPGQSPPDDDANPFGPDEQSADAAPPEPPELPPIEYGETPPDWSEQNVLAAWSRIMRDVREVGKGDEYKEEDRSQRDRPLKLKYRYRGIDRVLNAVGPALRKHGVVILPVKIDADYANITSRSGGSMRQCTMTVTYEITGPKGDRLTVIGMGEAFDTGDKSTTKAQTVAYRNMLIATLALPVGDPRLDAEAIHIERGEQPLPDPEVYYQELTAERMDGTPRISLGRVRQIRTELRAHPDIAQDRREFAGEEMTLWDISTRVGRGLEGGTS